MTCYANRFDDAIDALRFWYEIDTSNEAALDLATEQLIDAAANLFDDPEDPQEAE